MNLAAEALKEDRAELPDFTLKTVAARLGITVEKERLHDALYDVELTRAMYRKLTEKN
jgi:DNA polymerase-3 subunit epsilon